MVQEDRNEDGLVVYYKSINKDGIVFERWNEYAGLNLVHSENSYGCHTWLDYDDRGNQTHMKVSSKYYEYESFREYDENNVMIRFIDSTGFEKG